MRWIALSAGLAALALLGPGFGDAPAPRALPTPPFGYYSAAGKKARTKVRLVKVSEKRNQITDDADWLSRNGLKPPTIPIDQNGKTEGLPTGAPSGVNGNRIVSAIVSGKRSFLLYGPDYAGGRYLVALNSADSQPAYSLDFGKYITPPKVAKGEAEFVDEKLQWAQEADGVLYVANFHRTYARSSGHLNGYITALDPNTGRIKWRSRSLVCNSTNFLVKGDAIITGYGFTAEPDFLYVLDRRTGAIAQTVKLKSGPSWILEKGGRIYVRTYNTDYVFRVRYGFGSARTIITGHGVRCSTRSATLPTRRSSSHSRFTPRLPITMRSYSPSSASWRMASTGGATTSFPSPTFAPPALRV
jgi:hypothetical protein